MKSSSLFGLRVRFSCLAVAAVFFSDLALGWFVSPAVAAPDLYMKDTPAETGAEPNPDLGPMWISEDIWIRNVPDPAYQPYPFPAASPTWSPLPHENPEYRDPKFSLPNYVYIRVRNRGTNASTGNERLRVYWAKASTGLSWPSQWVDYLGTTCGPTNLYGMEITKPRKNAATATPAERDAYRDAVLDIGTLPPYVFPGGVSYFDKQDEVHEIAPGVAHSSPGFTPWHREMMDRYEVLLQQKDPLVKLLYWDWTTDPENSTAGFNFFTGTFMGASGRGTGGVPIGSPFNALSPPSVQRNLSPSTTPPAVSDATVLAEVDYSDFRVTLEVFAHNGSHGYIGGGGNMSFLNTAAEDPFFFLLHGNVDRLWAQWQRNISFLGRLDPATTYGADSALSSINNVMSPWDGTAGIRPWTVGDGYIVNKSPKHASLVSPPVYDLAPLVIPVLQPGEAVILQIPWYPPNPLDFSCFGTDQGHVCLLARIETSTSAPFGMTTPETTDVSANTKNNNNIVWKNITVVDNFPGALRLASLILRNFQPKETLTGLRLSPPAGFGASFFDFGTLTVDLKPELYKRWIASGRAGQGVEPVRENLVQFFSPQAFIQGIPLRPNESFAVDVRFQLNPNYRPLRGQTIDLDLLQIGTPDNPQAIAGGQRFQIDVSKLVLVKKSSPWRYWDAGTPLDAKWVSVEFDDQKWETGRAELGFEDDPVTPIRRTGRSGPIVTAYFRHTFTLSDPSFYRSLRLHLKRDDGAVVYLNGREVHRVHLPNGTPTESTFAAETVSGVAEETFWPTDLTQHLGLLRTGGNVIAVEIHQAASRQVPGALLPDDDLSFDLELSANELTANIAPEIAFTSPPDSAYFPLGEPILLTADALDLNGKIIAVSFFDGTKLLHQDSDAPYQFRWLDATEGRHRIRAVAVDDSQASTSTYITVTLVKNLPPIVDVTQPEDHTAFEHGADITAAASARDLRGKVVKVDFLLRRGHRFIDPFELTGSDTTEPYEFKLPVLSSGHYALQARAIDDQGASSLASPVHFEVMHGGPPRLIIEWMQGMIMLSWDTPGVLLEQSALLTGPWSKVERARSPFMVMPTERSRFFRLASE